MPTLFSVLAPLDVIEELSKISSLKGVKLGEPQPWDSMADAADSPMGPQEVQAGLDLVTVVLQTGTAFIGFVAAVIDVRNKLEKDETIKISDTNSGKKLGDYPLDAGMRIC